MLLYILRDVFRGIQKWRFEQPEVKLKMCKLILKIIVLALKQCDTLQVFYFFGKKRFTAQINLHLKPVYTKSIKVFIIKCEM